MSQHFQSGSPYGAPYHPGSYYPAYQQYPAPPQTSTPSFAQQPARPTTYQPSPNSNLGRFEANAQDATANPSFSFPTAPFTPDLLKHLANAAIPPPPHLSFPPVPVPNMGFPQLSQGLSSSHVFHPSPMSNVPEASDAYDPRFPHQPTYNSKTTSAIPASLDNSFEAQRKDEESTSSRTVSQEEYTQEQFDSSTKSHLPPNFDGSVFSRQAQERERPLEDVPSNGFRSGDFSIGAEYQGQGRQQQPASHTMGVAGTNSSSVHLQQPAQKEVEAKVSSLAEGMALNQKPSLRSYENKDPSELRQLAKGALLSLAPHSIHYAELVMEGIDGHVLQQLYEELGIKIGVQEPETPSRSGTAAQSQMQNASDSNQLHPNEVARSTEMAPPDNREQLPQVTAGNVDLLTAENAKPSPAVSPSLERKDRIAQLLAAKTGRPSPMRSFPESVPSTKIPDVRVTNEQLLSQSSTGPEGSSTQNTIADLEAKEVVQPEALKQNTNQPTEEALTNGKLQQSGPEVVTNLPSVNGSGPPLQISTQASAHDNLHHSPLSSIPGLFMTSADLSHTGETLINNLLIKDGATDSSRNSQKRAFEADVYQPDFQPSAKRRNTDTSGDAMEIDQSTEEEEATDGEILGSDTENTARTGNQSHVPLFAEVATSLPQPISSPSVAGTNTPASVRAAFTSQAYHSATPAKMRLTPAQIAEKAEMLKARFLKQRAERQKTLQEGLPDLDAEVQKTHSRLTQQQSQLSQVKARIERLDNDLLEARSQEKALIEEVAQLEKQLTEGVSGQKQYTDELKKLNGEQSIRDSPRTAPVANQVSNSQTLETSENSGPALVQDVPREPGPQHAPLPPNHGVAAKDTEFEASHTSGWADDFPSGRPSNGNVDDPTYEEGEAELDSPMPDVDVEHDVEPDEKEQKLAVAEKVFEAGSVPPVGGETEQAELDREGDEEEDGEIPEDSDGSASMSDSGPESDLGEEDDYEPDGPQTSNPIVIDQPEEGEYDPEEVQAEEAVQESPKFEEAIEDEYEPQPAEDVREDAENQKTPSSQMSAEMVDSPPAVSANVTKKINPFQAPFPVEVLSEPADNEMIESMKESRGEPGQDVHGVISQDPAQQHSAEALFSTGSQATEYPPLTNSAPASGTPVNYMPYQTPLSAFPSFRYHEQFQKSPPADGFRSLTYSNNIDSNVPLCQTELAGETCENSNCEEQHFRHLGLSDDKILVSLSSAQGIDKELREPYLRSLKQVIAGLRRDGVKEFEGVANALSEHRRDFLKKQEEGNL